MDKVDITKDDVLEEVWTAEEFASVTRDMSRIEGVEDFFRATIQADLLRYFNAPNESKDVVKGHLLFAKWFLNTIQKANNAKNVPVDKTD